MITGTPGDQIISGHDAHGDIVEFRLRETNIAEGSDGERIAAFHTYDCFHKGKQVHAMRLGIVNECDESIWVDLVPAQYEALSEWLFKQAAQLRAGERV